MQLTWRLFRRDWRAGELNALTLALLVAVASITSVGFFTDRVRQALALNAQQLLGADLLVSGDQPLPARYRQEAIARGLATAEAMAFMSMAGSDAGAHLTAVKAVGDGYPLRGRLRIATAPGAAEAAVGHGPRRGSVWVDPRFASLSGIGVGERLTLGQAKLRVDAILTEEPSRGLSFENLAPRVMMHLEDVPATALVQPGSRISYQLHVAGQAQAVAAYRAWLSARLARGQRVQGIEDARPEVREALARAQTFLGLSALLAVVLAAVAVHLASRRYVERHYDGYAVMRCLGARQAQLGRLFLGQLLLVGAIAGGLGCVVGFVAQAVVAGFMDDLLGIELPASSLLPALQGISTGYVLLLGFALPPLMQLKAVAAVRVLRRETGMPRARPVLVYALGLAALIALLLWQTQAVKLAAHTLGAFAVALLLFTLLALGTLRLLARLGRHAGFAWRYGLANLRRHERANIVQVVALALGLTSILLLAFTRADLIEAWQARTPPDAPNRFILNIQPQQRQAVLAFFRDQGLPVPQLYPMVRARLLAINGRPVRAETYADERTRALIEREFNLSYMSEPPRHNTVIAGSWFGEQEFARGALSIEAGIAKTLNIKLGDRLTWSVAGETLSAPVTNVRKLAWDSMQVNFFVIATPALLEAMPTSYITSFHLPPQRAAAMTELVRAFPNLTVIDTSAILQQVLELLQRITTAVQVIFLFALGAGVLVLYTALISRQGERVQEAALMLALGASRAQAAAAQRNEYLVIGLVAGTLAAAAAVAIGAVLAGQVFEFDRYTPDPLIWVAGPTLGMLSAALHAWLGARAALNAGPMAVLRQPE